MPPIIGGFLLFINGVKKRDRLGVGSIIAVLETLSRLDPSGVLMG
jgi:hypothetical protein